MVRRHPKTGRKNLYIGRHASHIKGQDEGESRALLQELVDKACQPPRNITHFWRAGDLVIWDGDPLEVGSVPVKVFIDGVEQPLDSHQSRLRERYRDLDLSDLPKAYDW